MKIATSIQLIFSTILVARATGVPRVRSKRIIGGEQLRLISRNQNYVYPAIRYTVWIGNGGLAPTDHWYSRAYALPESLKCGGVLLTPDIVLTACTCISIFVQDKSHSEHGDRSSPLTSFENRYEVYFGESDLSNMKHFILSKNYIIYERCRRFWFKPQGYDPEGRTHFPHVLHDFGLILMQAKIPDVEPLDAISYAPTSSHRDLVSFYYYALEKELMCLSFGYGSFEREGGPNAPRLTFSWRPLLNYYLCYVAVYADPMMKVSLFNYTEDSEWACSSPLKPKSDPSKFSTSEGDKGGPVTCNNEFFGILGESFWTYLSHLQPTKSRPRVNFVFVHPIVHILYITALEFKAEFLKKFHDRFDSEKNAVPAGIKTEIIFRPTLHLFSVSRSPKISASINLVLISIISLTPKLRP